MPIVADAPWKALNHRTLTVSFFDGAGAPVQPSSAYYRIDDVATGAVIVARTSLSVSSTSVDIEITAAQNAILDGRRPEEQHRLSLSWTYGAPAKDGAEDYLFTLERVKGTT